MIHSYADDKYYDYNKNDQTEEFNNLTDFDRLYILGIGRDLTHETENYEHLNNSRNNLNDLEPYENINSNYESYSNTHFNTEQNQNEQPLSIEGYDNLKMSEHVKMLEKKIPSSKQNKLQKTKSTSANKTKSTSANKTKSTSANKTKSISTNIKNLSIDMTPFFYNYKKYKKYKKNKKNKYKKGCSTSLITHNIYIKKRSKSLKNIPLICEYAMYVLFFIVLFCIFRRK
jgi:hypothetical protein